MVIRQYRCISENTAKYPDDVVYHHICVVGKKDNTVSDLKKNKESKGLYKMEEVDDDSEQRTGRTIYVPNSFAFLKPVINYSTITDFIWKEIKVLITFDSDIEKAVEELRKIVRRNSENPTRATIESMKKTSRKFIISYASMAPNIYISGNENGTVLNVRFLCMPDKCRDIQHNIWRDLVKRFNEVEGIDFSYSVSRVLRGTSSSGH